MTLHEQAAVYIVDDDASVREAMGWLLRTRRLLAQDFASAEAFAAALGDALPEHPACVLLDVRMPGMSGLALFEQLLASGVAHLWPVIFLSGHADVPTAVDAVKRGAFDFCEKPFSDNALVDRVEQALALSRERIAARQARQALARRLEDLTERERDVMQTVVRGLASEQIAEQFGISVRTVEVHRARVFEKMAVKSAVELATLLQKHA
jgi:two-component system response regulator DctR